MSRTLVVIGCGKEKQPKGWRGPLIDLYIGSYYRAVRAYAESLGGPHFILSAFVGCRRPDYETIAYDRPLAKEPKESKACFAGIAFCVLCESSKPGDRIIVLAGKEYYQGWRAQLVAAGRVVETPLAGMGIGKQKQWMIEQTAAQSSAVTIIKEAPMARALVEAFSGDTDGPRIFVSQTAAQLVWPTGRIDLTLHQRRLTYSVAGKLRRKSLALSRLRGAAAMLSVPLVEVAS